MVGMPRRSSSWLVGGTVEQVRSRCLLLQQEFEVHFLLNFPLGSACPAISPAMLSGLERQLQQAAELALAGSTIEVSAYNTRRGLEVEITADCRSESDMDCSAFQRASTVTDSGCSVTSFQARCCDGSVAWILVQSRHSHNLRRAA